ncbi:hypothetical protein N9349_05325 [Candidatus Pelagibacter sp.]|nr:hypothetical protein [Candidatus Pelagibacter sp.]
MGATYTRQSTSAIVDGGVIEASDINAEFNQILAAFAVTSGHTHDGTTAEGGPITKLLGTTITIGDGSAGTDIAITFDGESNDGVLTWMEDEDYFQFSDDLLVTTTEKLQFRDTAIYINSSADGQLDLVADTEIQIAATTVDINGNVDVSGTLTVGGALDFSDANITNIGSIALDTITNDGTDITLDSSGDIILDADGADIFLKDAGTTYGSLTNSSGNLIVKSGTTTALTFSGADVTVAGDLTVSGDDITMGTNTAGHLLIADGTNFNSVAVGSLSEISSIASDDVFLAVDTSGGGLKKVARSTVVSGLATSSAISNVSEDTTPQLGGNLDVNGNDIVTTSNADIELAPNGTGKVIIKGNTNQGKIVLNCEANSHGQTIIAAPHSESANNVLTLPSTGGDSRLVSATSTATLTNKTLTTPVIAEIDSGSSITLDATTDIVLDAGGADVTLKDDGTTFGSLTNSSGELVIKSGSTPTTAMTFNGANVTFAGTVTIGSAGISEAELEILDGATVTTTELNIIDGDTSASSTTLVDADRIVTNDNGTMKQVALTDVKTYLSSAGFATDDPTALAIALG